MLGTGEPPPSVTVRPVVGVLGADHRAGRHRVQARAQALDDAARIGVGDDKAQRAAAAAVPGVAGHPRERRRLVGIRADLQRDLAAADASSPLVLAHSGRAVEVESTVSVARRAYTWPAPLQAPSQVAGMLGMLASSSSRLLPGAVQADAVVHVQRHEFVDHRVVDAVEIPVLEDIAEILERLVGVAYVVAVDVQERLLAQGIGR